MFAEFMFIALAVCLLLGACSEGYPAYETSFGALLERTILNIWTGLAHVNTGVRDNTCCMQPMRCLNVISNLKLTTIKVGNITGRVDRLLRMVRVLRFITFFITFGVDMWYLMSYCVLLSPC